MPKSEERMRREETPKACTTRDQVAGSDCQMLDLTRDHLMPQASQNRTIHSQSIH